MDIIFIKLLDSCLINDANQYKLAMIPVFIVKFKCQQWEREVQTESVENGQVGRREWLETLGLRASFQVNRSYKLGATLNG